MVKQRITLKDVDIAVGGRIIGGAEEFSISISRDDQFAHQGGSYKPVEIVDGKFEITGSINRAYIDSELLNELVPNDGPRDGVDISVRSKNKDPTRVVKVFGAKFNTADINSLNLDSYGRNSLSFNAIDWKFEDE